MVLQESAPNKKHSQLRRWQFLSTLFLSTMFGAYLWLELGWRPAAQDEHLNESIHFLIGGLIWAIGMLASQYGFRKISKSANQLAVERNNLISIFETAQVGMLLIDQQFRVRLVNQTIFQKFDTPQNSSADHPLGIILRCPNMTESEKCGHTQGCESCSLMSALRQALNEGQQTVDQEALLHYEHNGQLAEMWVLYSVKPMEIDRRQHALLSLLDITDRLEVQKQLQNLAFFDPLTRLPNREQFNLRLEQVISEARRHAKKTATGVMFLDLDGFKMVNDTLGHEVGDQLLRKVGKRLERCIRKNDLVARLGGDEFALILPEVRQGVDLAVVARHILAAIDTPFIVSGKEIFVTTSIGIACAPTDSNEPAELLRFADAAMYHAKGTGRNNFQFYSEAMTRCAAERLELEADLRKALPLGQLELFYQPKVDTIVGLLVGCEALLRWQHPTRGLVSPDQFIGIAEDTGLIIDIGVWILQTACRAAVEWNRAALYPVKVAINLSVRQFLTGDIVETVSTALHETGCRPEWLELEITESLLMAHKAKIVNHLKDLNKLGVSIAIDDFGTGYSSLSYLIQFPVSTLKIDRMFIREITTGKKSLELVKAIVSMGHALGLELVAEGVESPEQAACLDKIGCHVIQGYLYSQPLPAVEFTAWTARFYQQRQAEEEDQADLSLLTWRDYLTTGHELIDAQHRELFRRIAKLSLACRSGKGQVEISQLLDYLRGYVATHFSAEEELLRLINSSRYAEHKAAHDYFSTVIDTLLTRYRQDGETMPLSLEVHCVAIDWLTRHICSMDRELATEIKQLGMLGIEGEAIPQAVGIKV